MPAPVPLLEIALRDGSRVPLVDELTIGRSSASTVQLADPSVSRRHARISLAADGTPVLEDVGSSYGTWLDGRRVETPEPLRAGSRIRLGHQELVVDRRPTDDEAGHTLVVGDAAAAPRFGGRPQLRGGYALKRLEVQEGDRRWVLKDLRSPRYLRLSEHDAELFTLIDGSRSLPDLIRDAEQRQGPDGPARLTLLLAALAARGFLAGAEDQQPRARRRFATRTLSWTGAGAWFAWLYSAGGRFLLTRPALAGLSALALTGAVVFAYLVAGRYGTPFVVASKLGLGGIVFVLGRLALAAVHEAAHGLVMASFGRPVREAGLKLFLIFPYAYVDTSDAWFEPRRRRIAVSAAGPASDLCLGGVFALGCLLAPPSALRDVCFQLAFGAYLGAFFNLNPCVERDGYHILVDVLREPGLRRRAIAQLRRRLADGDRTSPSPVLARYALLVVAWSALGAGMAAVLSLRYEPVFARLVPAPVVWAGMGLVWLALLVPLLALTGMPLLQRLRTRIA